MNIGYLGPAGTFSQEAAIRYTRGRDYKLIPYVSITDLIRAADRCEVDEAIVPIENSIEGSVTATLDLLAWESHLKIKGEILVPIVHNLMVKKGTEKVESIISHSQAIGQCRDFLETHYKGIACQSTASTARAAQIVATSTENVAAIASETAAAVYGLDIVHRSIQEFIDNTTRFIVLSEEVLHSTGSDITSVVLSTENRPGALRSVLKVIDVWGLNMTRIESRPARERLGTYIFFIDIQGHIEDHAVKEAMGLVKRRSGFFKILGSYPASAKLA